MKFIITVSTIIIIFLFCIYTSNAGMYHIVTNLLQKAKIGQIFSVFSE